MHSSSLLFLIGFLYDFILWFLTAGRHRRDRTTTRSGVVGEPPHEVQGRHAATGLTVDFRQGTVKVTFSSVGNVANHWASFTDCVGGHPGRG